MQNKRVKYLINYTKLLSCLLLFSTIPSFAYEENQYIRFEPFLNCSIEQAIHEAGALPIYLDYSREQLDKTFEEFIRGDDVNEMSRLLEEESAHFFASSQSAPWQNSHYRFGIFGSKESTHKKTRLIQGINCKMCLEYCDWLKENRGDLLEKTPQLSKLLTRLTDLDRICHEVFLQKVQEIALSYPEINKIFYTYKEKPRLPITLRLIRFENAEQFTLPLHFDISVMSLIFPSDDHPLDECLIVAPADGSNFRVEQLKRALRPIPKDPHQSCGLLISGTLLPYLNIPILPTPHGVIPHHRASRCVM